MISPDLKQRIISTYILIQHMDNDPALLKALIDPLFNGVPWADQHELAGELWGQTLYGHGVYPLTPLALHVDSTIGG